jgi:hypothetical protein
MPYFLLIFSCPADSKNIWIQLKITKYTLVVKYLSTLPGEVTGNAGRVLCVIHIPVQKRAKGLLEFLLALFSEVKKIPRLEIISIPFLSFLQLITPKTTLSSSPLLPSSYPGRLASETRLFLTTFYTAEYFLITSLHGPHGNTASIFKDACLLLRYLAIDVIFLCALAGAGICLMWRCLAMGIHVKICSYHSFRFN